MYSLLTVTRLKATQLLLIVLLLSSFNSFSQQDKWTSIPAMANAMPGKSTAVSFTIGEKAYIGTGDGFTKDFWEYDIPSGVWTKKADFAGEGRAYASGFSIGNKGYIGIGMKGTLYADPRRDFWEYDPAIDKWTQKANVPTTGQFSSFAFSLKGKGYIFAGYNWNSALGQGFEYDPVLDKWTGLVNQIPARYNAVCFTIGGKAYAGTGTKTSFENRSKDFYEFDADTKAWTRIADFPGTPTSMATSFALAGKGYVAGGYTETYPAPAYPNSLWQYDPIANTWKQKTAMPIAQQLTYANAFTLGSKGFVTSKNQNTGRQDVFAYEVGITETLKVVFTGDTFVNLDWENFNTVAPVAGYDIYVDGEKKYTTNESSITADQLQPNTSYTFTIVGKDINGVSTPVSDPKVASTINATTGLKYRYYEGNWNNLPNFNALASINNAVSPNIDITKRPAGKNDHFGFVWEGYINLPTAGEYTFETVSGDGSRFYFNSFYNPSATPLINNDGIHTPTTPMAGTVNLAPGRYPVALSFFNRDGGAAAQLYWTGPAGSGITRQLVPDAAFTASYNPLADTELPSTPANINAHTVARNFVYLKWDKSTDNVGVAFYDIYVNGVFRISTSSSPIVIDSLTANTAYTFTIKARDVAGNTSAFSNPLVINTINTATGLNYRFYQGDWNTLPDFNLLTPVKTGISPNADISVRPLNVNDRFGFVWEGSINIPYPGNYTFETISDDGSRIYFNSFYSLNAIATVNNDGVHGATTPVAGTVNIPLAGQYPITITYFDKDSRESLQLYWTGPVGSGINRQLIPDLAFQGNYTAPADIVSPTTPANLRAINISNNRIAFDWDNSTDNVGIAFYDVYINGEKKYSTNLSEIIADSLVANTNYQFAVISRDVAGNLSGSTNLIQVSTTRYSNGLNYRYFEGDWDALPDFSSLVPVKKGLSPNVDLDSRSTGVNDRFGFLWEGAINIITPGTYTFETVSDDGSKIYFNTDYSTYAIPLVNNDGLHGPGEPAKGTVTIITPGRYPIAITYFEKDGGEAMQVYWTGPAGSGINRQLIPDMAFRGDVFNSADLIAPTTPANPKVILASRTRISIDWDNSTDNVGVAFYDVYVNGIKKYTTVSSALVADSLQPATTYQFTIRARDVAGNMSPFSAPLRTTTTRMDNGFTYRYFEGDWNVLPDFNALNPLQTGLSTNVDISVRPTGVHDRFGFVWEGSINIPVPGSYKFETISDDGSKLYFDQYYSASAQALVDNDGLHAASPVSGMVNVPAAGKYPFAVTFFEKDGGETMQVYWTGPGGSGITRQLIPDSAFASSYLTLLDSIPPATPLNLAVTGINATSLKLNWGTVTGRNDILRYDIYFNGAKKYSIGQSTNYIAKGLVPNTLYTIKMAAIDSAGNSSAFSNEVSTQTLFTTDGLDYKYYEGNWDMLPNFSTLTPVQQGTAPNVELNVRPAGRNDNFAIVWTGFIKVPTWGRFIFDMNSDDGSRLSVNGYEILNNDGVHPAATRRGEIDIPNGGAYPITISYFEKDGGEKMEMYWVGPGMPYGRIPDSAFVRYVPGISFIEGGAASNNLNAAIIQEVADGKGLVRMYPNPFSESFQVEFNNEKASDRISLDVYDLNGRLVLSKNPGKLFVGRNSLTVRINDKNVIPGIYMVRLGVNGRIVKTYKIVKRN